MLPGFLPTILGRLFHFINQLTKLESGGRAILLSSLPNSEIIRPPAIITMGLASFLGRSGINAFSFEGVIGPLSAGAQCPHWQQTRHSFHRRLDGSYVASMSTTIIVISAKSRTLMLSRPLMPSEQVEAMNFDMGRYIFAWHLRATSSALIVSMLAKLLVVVMSRAPSHSLDKNAGNYQPIPESADIVKEAQTFLSASGED